MNAGPRAAETRWQMWRRAAANLLFPWRCRHCGVSGPRPNCLTFDLCADCRPKLPKLTGSVCLGCAKTLGPHAASTRRCPNCRRLAGISETVALFHYQGLSRSLLHSWKYHNPRRSCRDLAEALAAAIQGRGLNFDVIVPVPMHWLKQLQRPGHHTALLTQALARRLGKQALPKALRRIKMTRNLWSLGPEARKQELHNAIALGSGVGSAKRVLLVDDIRTTGATASACARALKRAGVRHVYLAVLAVADKERDSPAP